MRTSPRKSRGLMLLLVLALASCDMPRAGETPIPTPLPTSSTSDAPASQQPTFAIFDAEMPISATAKPASTGSQPDAYAFAVAIYKSALNAWQNYVSKQPKFPALRPVGFDIVAKDEKPSVTCDNVAHEVRSNYPNLFYCPSSEKHASTLIIPLDTISSMWDSVPRPTGDLAAAITISRHVSYAVLDDFESSFAWGVPTGNINRAYTATCLSGIWAHSAYPQGSIGSELTGALEKSVKAPSEIDGTILSADSTAELEAAWQTGYTTGVPGECFRRYYLT